MTSNFLSLFDDIAALMDDVAALSKHATKKTAGLLADDLAVNAEKASGFVSSRELPALWRITKGSLLNKVIILPLAFLLSAFLPEAIVPILLLGGTYLAYEGAEKVAEYLFHKQKKSARPKRIKMTPQEAKEFEDQKVKSAILVDFILSIEIIIIALSSVIEQELLMQIIVVTVIALLATVGVYGLVALLVRMDDFGLSLMEKSEDESKFIYKFGSFLVKVLPYIIRGLGLIGTIAMFLVAGGIFIHNIEFVDKLFHSFPSITGDLIVGLAVGLVALGIIRVVKKALKKEGSNT